MERAATFVRVAPAGQDEAGQVPDVERYCAEHGYEVVKRFSLSDRAAFKGEDQEVLDHMLEDIRDGAYTVLVVWAADRLTRQGGSALMNTLAEIRRAGGRVESVTGPALEHPTASVEALTALAAVMSRAGADERAKRAKAERRSTERGLQPPPDVSDAIEHLKLDLRGLDEESPTYEADIARILAEIRKLAGEG